MLLHQKIFLNFRVDWLPPILSLSLNPIKINLRDLVDAPRPFWNDNQPLPLILIAANISNPARIYFFIIHCIRWCRTRNEQERLVVAKLHDFFRGKGGGGKEITNNDMMIVFWSKSYWQISVVHTASCSVSKYTREGRVIKSCEWITRAGTCPRPIGEFI